MKENSGPRITPSPRRSRSRLRTLVALRRVQAERVGEGQHRPMRDDGPRPFGDLLKRYRLRASLSQEELAELAHLNQNTVSGLERGARQAPYSHTVEALANALGLSPTDRAHLHSVAERARRRGPTARLSRAADNPSTPNSLPTELSSFVGREDDVAKVVQLLASHRLVTL